jgi:hypothetical protein
LGPPLCVAPVRAIAWSQRRGRWRKANGDMNAVAAPENTV